MTDADARERPIIFSAPMVRALLDGRKTQTRRIVKPQPEYSDVAGAFGTWVFKQRQAGDWWLWPNASDKVLAECPYGVPGDRLWVRETWCPSPDGIIYRATEAEHGIAQPDDYNVWKSAIHLRRADARITLEITDAHVERLQDISQEDCRAEGCAGGHGAIPGYAYSATPREHFRYVWQAINGGDSMHDNPWVWALTFKRVTALSPEKRSADGPEGDTGER